MTTGVKSWSQTAADNATADANVNWAEGQAPSSVNDSSRAMMASVAKWRDDLAGSLTTGGTSTAYTLSTNQVFSSLSEMAGQAIRVTFHAANGASATLNVDSLGAKSLVSVAGTAIPSGNILANSVVDLVYDNSNSCWIVVGATFSDIPSGTKMLFQQTAAPSGWTKSTTHNDKALRVVSGTASSGGSTAFTSVFTSRTIAQANLPNVTLTTSIASGQGSHSHTFTTQDVSGGAAGTIAPGGGAATGTGSTSIVTLPAMTGTTPLGGSGTALDFAVQYVDCIIATKN